MEKVDVLGITSHFENLPFGKKDSFLREIADAIGQSTNTVRRKIQSGKWRKFEIPIVTKIMQK